MAVRGSAPLAPLCAALGVSRATVYRRLEPRPPKRLRPRPERALEETEKQRNALPSTTGGMLNLFRGVPATAHQLIAYALPFSTPLPATNGRL
jgi:hypothetical protein